MAQESAAIFLIFYLCNLANFTDSSTTGLAQFSVRCSKISAALTRTATSAGATTATDAASGGWRFMPLGFGKYWPFNFLDLFTVHQDVAAILVDAIGTELKHKACIPAQAVLAAYAGTG